MRNPAAFKDDNLEESTFGHIMRLLKVFKLVLKRTIKKRLTEPMCCLLLLSQE